MSKLEGCVRIAITHSLPTAKPSADLNLLDACRGQPIYIPAVAIKYMGEYFTASGGHIVAEVSIDGNAISGAGSTEMPVLLVMLNILYRSPGQLNSTFDFREMRCRLSPFESNYIAHSLPTSINIRLASGEELPNQSVYLEVPLDQNRIATIDRMRKGGDAKLRFDLELLADELVELPVPPKAPRMWAHRSRHHMRTKVHAEIPRSKWGETVLPQLGFGKAHILELPVVPIENCAKMKTAFEALQKACSLERQGFYPEAVASCRIAMEPFFEVVDRVDASGQTKKARALKSSWESRLGKATYDWLNASLIAAKQGTDVTHHVPSPGFGQLEAQMMLSVATALIAYAIKTKPDGLT